MFETSIDVYDEDLELFRSTTATMADLQEQLAYMISDARRKTEVSLRNLTAEERKLMEQAKDKEVDQWISNAVFKIVRRTGVPITRIMAMRWILTWKEAPEGTKAKARLVAKRLHRPRPPDDSSRSTNLEQNRPPLPFTIGLLPQVQT